MSIADKLRSSKLIRVKDLEDGISSYNFTRDAFWNKQWNSLTMTARGLFMKDDFVVCRGYPKFFNIEERPSTGIRSLENKLVFPISLYKKENGFLGMVSHYPDSSKPFVASKSTNEGAFAEYLTNAILKVGGEDLLNKLGEMSRELDSTFIFECIDPVNDPHIIKYDDVDVVLLDIVKNTIDEDIFYSYDEILEIANQISDKLHVKKLVKTIDSLKDFLSWYEESNLKDPLDDDIEGYVITDAAGYRVKYKTVHYRMWKYIRKILERYQNKNDLEKYKNTIKEFHESYSIVYEFLSSFSQEELLGKTLIELKDMFYREYLAMIDFRRINDPSLILSIPQF